MARAALIVVLVVGQDVPGRNPIHRPEWTDEIAWGNVVRIGDFPGDSADARFEAAQEALGAKGGVVRFPPGTYRFRDTIRLGSGVVIRGADPVGVTDARKEGYDPPTRFEFPRFEPKLEGEGTPYDTAFKGIQVKEPATASNCGVVNVSINHGHILLAGGADQKAGRNRLVYGCVLRHAVHPNREVPDRAIGQHAWQRHPHGHTGAIHVVVEENALVANNALPPSTESFPMKGYVIHDRKKRSMTVEEGVVFDYDNRPGIRVNAFGIGGAGGSDPNGTPETHPHGFRKGILIRDNFVFSTGRTAISFTGDGTDCSFNVIRFKPEVVRWTNTGRHLVAGSSTNDNRAIEARGWRWRIEGNDYEVHRNRVPNSAYYINDGEGIMHEDHVNSTVKESVLLNNKGNSYLSIYRTAGIDGLLVQGNDIRTPGGIHAIYVDANRAGPQKSEVKFPCRNVRILDNRTAGSGIKIAGDPAEGNVVRGNRHAGSNGRLENRANALLEDNEGYAPVVK